MHVDIHGPGDAPTILLLHGGGVSGWMWTPLARTLAEKYRLIIPDLPGHGQSSGEDYVSHPATVETLAALIREHAAAPVAVIGFSLGAQLAIGLAACHLTLVNQVMVVSAQAKPMAGSELAIRFLNLTAPLARKRWFARLQARQLFVPAELMDHYIDTSARFSTATLAAAVGSNLRFSVPDQWSRFPGQVLVMAGQRERTLMKQSAALISAALPGSSLETVERCGHGIPFQRPEWFSRRVQGWLSGQPD